jgi:hypothetical protein
MSEDALESQPAPSYTDLADDSVTRESYVETTPADPLEPRIAIVRPGWDNDLTRQSLLGFQENDLMVRLGRLHHEDEIVNFRTSLVLEYLAEHEDILGMEEGNYFGNFNNFDVNTSDNLDIIYRIDLGSEHSINSFLARDSETSIEFLYTLNTALSIVEDVIGKKPQILVRPYELVIDKDEDEYYIFMDEIIIDQNTENQDSMIDLINKINLPAHYLVQLTQRISLLESMLRESGRTE